MVSGAPSVTPQCPAGSAPLLIGPGLSLVCMATAALVPLLTWSHLPDPLAIHFASSGAANGTASRLAVIILGVALAAVGSAGTVWAVFVRSRSPSANASALRVGLAVFAFIAGLGAAVEVTTVIANYGARYWSLAQMPSYGLVVLLALPVLMGVLEYLTTGRVKTTE